MKVVDKKFVDELQKMSGSNLHLLVAHAEGRKVETVPTIKGHRYLVENDAKDWMLELEYYTPSTSWGQGGPIVAQLLEQGKFMIGNGIHQIYVASPGAEIVGLGNTTLLAAMRAFVLWKLGAINCKG